jgi:TPR repeat protein
MNSKVIPLIGVMLIIAVAGFLYKNQMQLDQEARLLSPEAQFSQGEMYEMGWGRPKDTPETIRWYKLAANGGHAEAQFRLANLYYKGVRVEQDFNEAANWYLQAANNGHVEAEYRLGFMYQNGEGVPKDRVEAEKWLTLAREQSEDKTPPNSG